MMKYLINKSKIDAEIIDILKEHGELKTLDILDRLNSRHHQSKLGFSRLYPSLNRLHKRNLIVFRVQNRFKYYQLTDSI